MGIIYCATNIANDKKYIGQTTKTLEFRKAKHLNDRNRNYHFYNAIRLYGKDSFRWEVIDQSDSKTELNEKESYWIAFYETTDPQKGYNMTFGGEGGIPTEEVRKKISRAALGNTRNLGRFPSVETKKRISESRLEGKNPIARAVLCTETNEVFPTITLAAFSYNMFPQSVYQCCIGKHKTAGGYHWQYVGKVG